MIQKSLLALCLSLMQFSISANDYIEISNAVSNSYNGVRSDLQIIRPINGGTVIIPEFDSSCPEEMKSPFAYACKIVEEYIPPCLPLRVQVSCGRLSRYMDDGIISRVYTYADTLPEYTSPNRKIPMPQIKAMVLAEISMSEYMAHYEVIPDEEYLTERPDIKIVYNTMRLDDISFSLEMPTNTQFDFVSLAIRDLLRGLGLSSSFTQNPISKGLDNPTGYMTQFERCIDDALGYPQQPDKRMDLATKGKLLLNTGNNQALELYAPEKWENGISLNYFIPQEDCLVSKSLSYDFGRGTVIRNLSDNYSSIIFQKLLGWQPDFLVSIGSANYSSSGSSSLRLPYNGSMSINFGSNNARHDVMYNPPLTQSNNTESHSASTYILISIILICPVIKEMNLMARPYLYLRKTELGM